MEELIGFLNSVYPMSKELENHLIEILEFKVFKEGEYLVKAGRICGHVYFVLDGLLRSFYYGKRGREINLWFMKQGDVVYAERSFLDQIPSTISIQALRDTSAFFISHKQLYDIYERFMVFNVHGRKLTEKYYKQSLEREEIMRMPDPIDRYNYLLEHFTDIANLVPDKDLATFLNMTPVTLSRIRNKRLRRQGKV